MRGSAAALADREVVHDQVRVLGRRPPEHDERHLRRHQHARDPEAPPPAGPARRRPRRRWRRARATQAQGRRGQLLRRCGARRRRPAAGSTSAQTATTGRGDQRAPAEVVGQLGRARLDGQVGGRQVGAQGQREQAGGQRERRQPGAERRADHRAGRVTSMRPEADGPHHHAQQHRRDHAGDGEGQPVAPPRRGPASKLRKAKLEPRKTTPSRNSVSGTCRAIDSAAKAGGKPVNSSTTTRISQTWLASQIGPMARSMIARWAALRGPGGQQVPDAAAEVGPAEQEVEDQRRHHGARPAAAQAPASCRSPVPVAGRAAHLPVEQVGRRSPPSSR